MDIKTSQNEDPIEKLRYLIKKIKSSTRGININTYSIYVRNGLSTNNTQIN